VLKFHRVFLLGEVDVGSEVIVPDFLCVSLFAGRFIDKKQDVGLDAVGIENAGRKLKDRM
jgi:hypothetical protein